MQNHSKGLLLLADCYATGKGVEQSIPETLKNYKRENEKTQYILLFIG